MNPATLQMLVSQSIDPWHRDWSGRSRSMGWRTLYGAGATRASGHCPSYLFVLFDV